MSLIKQFSKMVLVGCSGLFLQFASFNVLRLFLAPMVSTQIAVVLAIINNFYFHGRITFASKSFHWNMLYSRFGLMYLLYSSLMVFLQGQWLVYICPILGSGPAIENLVVFLGMIWGSILNFIVYRYFLFAHPK